MRTDLENFVHLMQSLYMRTINIWICVVWMNVSHRLCRISHYYRLSAFVSSLRILVWNWAFNDLRLMLRLYGLIWGLLCVDVICVFYENGIVILWIVIQTMNWKSEVCPVGCSRVGAVFGQTFGEIVDRWKYYVNCLECSRMLLVWVWVNNRMYERYCGLKVSHWIE